MAQRAGSADLPLHGGRGPKWRRDRMTRLGAVMSEAIVHEYGRDELLRRLAHPFWFQSFGAVMGMTGIPPASPRAYSARLSGASRLSPRVTLHNEENGFCVLRVKARGQRAAYIAIFLVETP